MLEISTMALHTKTLIFSSQVKGTGQSKEGFSVFNVFDRTSSPGGRRALREWFKSPLANVEKISNRQDGVGLFAVPEFKEIEKQCVAQLKKVYDTPTILLRIKKVQASYRDWIALSATFEALYSAIDYLRVLYSRTDEHSQRAWLQAHLERCDAEALRKCYKLIFDSIDVEMSKDSKQTCIREGQFFLLSLETILRFTRNERGFIIQVTMPNSTSFAPNGMKLKASLK